MPLLLLHETPTNYIIRAGFGGMLAFLYVTSGYNLAVPIVVRTLSNFVLMTAILWLIETNKDLKNRKRN
jgi:hypothetical protein